MTARQRQLLEILAGHDTPSCRAIAAALADIDELQTARDAFVAWDRGPHSTDSSLDPVRKLIYAAPGGMVDLWKWSEFPRTATRAEKAAELKEAIACATSRDSG